MIVIFILLFIITSALKLSLGFAKINKQLVKDEDVYNLAIETRNLSMCDQSVFMKDMCYYDIKTSFLVDTLNPDACNEANLTENEMRGCMNDINTYYAEMLTSKAISEANASYCNLSVFPGNNSKCLKGVYERIIFDFVWENLMTGTTESCTEEFKFIEFYDKETRSAYPVLNLSIALFERVPPMSVPEFFYYRHMCEDFAEYVIAYKNNDSDLCTGYTHLSDFFCIEKLAELNPENDYCIQKYEDADQLICLGRLSQITESAKSLSFCDLSFDKISFESNMANRFYSSCFYSVYMRNLSITSRDCESLSSGAAKKVCRSIIRPVHISNETEFYKILNS
jgi:hypothetical protein